MDALKRSILAITIIATLLCIVPMAADTDGYGEADGFLLYQISPYDDDEGVSVYNYGDSTLDLKGYQIVTKNYTMSVTTSISVASDSFVTLYHEYVEGSAFINQGSSYKLSDVCKLEDSTKTLSDIDNIFINSNDYVHLKDSSGKVLDAVYYGTIKDIDTSLWTGPALTISSHTTSQRVGTFDTDSADDWKKFVPGKTYIPFDPDLKFDATVTPFLFPESGGIPVLQALESAQKSICITLYQFTNRNVYSLLCDKADQGVDIKVLVEGEVYNYDLSTDLTYMKALVDHGVEVRLIGVADEDSTDRYTYVHAKYTLIDGEKVIVTSENWSKANLNGTTTTNPYTTSNGNRGWGAVIESKDYYDFMKKVFDQDFSTEYGDVKPLLDLYPNVKSAAIEPYVEHESATFKSYKAKVTPVLSSDNSFTALKYYINNASTRVYAQHQSLGNSYQTLDSSSPVYYLSQKASAGVDTKLILSSKDNNMSAVLNINQSTMVKAACMTSAYVHNKGLVCDDYVWVSSINWTDTSFNYNREVCAVIESSEIADYFASVFQQDFDMYYSYDGFRIDTSSIKESYTAGKEITFEVAVTPSGNYTYVWDLGDGSDPITTTVPRVACKPISTGDASAYVLTLTVTDNETGQTTTVTKNYSVVKDDSSGLFSGDKSLIFALIIIAILVVAMVIKFAGLGGSKSKKKSTKTGSSSTSKSKKRK